MLSRDHLDLEVARLRNVLRDIAYLGQGGSPFDEPCAVAKECSRLAKVALGMIPDAAVSGSGERGNGS